MSPVESQFHESVVEATRCYLRRLYPSEAGMRVGFKEVLNSPGAVDLFREAFPKALVVLLARHPVSAWHSLPPDWNLSLDDFIGAWRSNTEGYSKRGKLYWFEDLVSDAATQSEIAELAGLTSDQMTKVLAIRVNSSAKFSKRTDEEIGRILHECQDLIPERVSVIAGYDGGTHLNRWNDELAKGT